jgi:cytochrome P450
MAELMRNPRVTQKAQDEVQRALAGDRKVTEDILPNLQSHTTCPLVIKETLRLHPPAPLLLPRKCGSPCQVLGFDVPEGTMVIVNAWAIARDPAHWEDPDELSPERFETNGRDFKGSDFELIPFGAGRRMCPGVAFGLAHIELALAALLFHFDWELHGGMAAEELDMAEAFGVGSRRSDKLTLSSSRSFVFPCPRSRKRHMFFELMFANFGDTVTIEYEPNNVSWLFSSSNFSFNSICILKKS